MRAPGGVPAVPQAGAAATAQYAPFVRLPLIIETDPDDPDCADVLVDGTVAGRPYRFVLDTGAARTKIVADDFISTLSPLAQHSSAGVFAVVDQAFLLRHADLFEEVGDSVGTDSSGAQAGARTFLMTGPRIGGALFARHKVAVVDLSRANASLDRPMDLVLGYTTLRQASWLLDFPARRWAITSGPAPG